MGHRGPWTTHSGAQDGARTAVATVNGAAGTKRPNTQSFVVVAMETGGSWSTEGLEFVSDNGNVTGHHIGNKGRIQYTGKTHIWNRAGIRLQDVDNLGEEV